MVEQYLQACGGESPGGAALELFKQGFGLPVRPGSKHVIELESVLGEQATAAFKRVESAWLVGLVGDDIFEERTKERAETDSEHDGIVIFLLDVDGAADRPLFRNQVRALNRAFHHTPVVVLFRHRSARGICLTLATCERRAYKLSHLAGEKPGRVTLSSPFQLEEIKEEQVLVLEQLVVSPDYLRVSKSFTEIVSHWSKVFTGSELGLLRESFLEWVHEFEDFPDLDEFRERFGYRGLQLMGGEYRTYERFLKAVLPERGQAIEEWIGLQLEAAITDFWHGFNQLPLEESFPVLISTMDGIFVHPDDFSTYASQCRNLCKKLAAEGGRPVETEEEQALLAEAVVNQEQLAEMSGYFDTWISEYRLALQDSSGSEIPSKDTENE